MPTTERKRMALEEASKQDNFVMNEEFQTKFLDLVQNEFLSRGAFIQRWMDPRRDYNRECGYPETYEITSEKWQDYYERHPIAGRVVELMPTECWQITPDVYEDEDPNNITPFEEGLKNIANMLRGQNSYYQPEKEAVHPLWEACRRVDILSGIGQFGVMLLGFDDGLSLNQPVEGWQEPETGNITWNEEALQFLRTNVSEYIELDPSGQLIWNARPEEEEEPQDKKQNPFAKKPAKSGKQQEEKQNPFKKGTKPEETNGKKTTKVAIDQQQSSKGYLPPEPSDDPSNSIPNQEAFGNINPQQGKYRDPMDVHGQDKIVPQGVQQPEYGKFSNEPNNTEGSGIQDKSRQTGQQARRLVYVRCFPESLVQIMQYEQNLASPRFGQPTMYRITLNDPMQNSTGVGLPLSTIEVHYSRIIHVADVGENAVSSEIFAAPRMRPVLNNLIDLQKILGACGEGYWKNAFATLAAETHPQLGGDVTLDVEAMREQMKKWRDSLDRVLAATGVTWKTISPQVVDPNSYVQNELTAICIKKAVPLRVFMGSEQGVLAASQDAIAWSFRVKERRKNYLTPRLIVPLIDRLIQVGVLPVPQNGYSVDWNDEQKLMPQEQASIAGAMTGALATYISGQVDQLIEPVTWLVEVCGWEQEKAQAAVDATLEHLLKQQEQQALQGQNMIDPTTGQPMEQDEQGQYIDPNTGEPAQTDEFGKPLVIDPATGQPMPAQQQSPSEQQGPLGAEAAEADQQMNPQQQDMIGEEEQPVDENGEPLDTGEQPDTGEEEGEYLVDPETGDIYDPQTGEVIGNLNDLGQGAEGEEQPPTQELEGPISRDEEEGQQPTGEEQTEEAPDEGTPGETDEETGLPIDPRTGRIVNPENGYQLDKETGDIYDPSGALWGNLEDRETPEENE